MSWTIDAEDEWSPEGFWASYSDLMAGILMIFALSSLLMTFKAIQITEKFDRWRSMNERLCQTEALTKLGVDIRCETGAITFAMDEEWFDFNRTTLKEGGKRQLRQIVPVYLQAITDDAEMWDHVDMIEIGGYADRQYQDGRRDANIQISSQRALEVMLFLLGDEAFAEYKQQLFDKAVAVGYGDQDYPEGCGEERRCAEARRVVIRSEPKNASLLEELVREIRWWE